MTNKKFRLKYEQKMMVLSLKKLGKWLIVFGFLCVGIISADVKLTNSNYVSLLDVSSDGKKVLFSTSKNNNSFNLATISTDGSDEKLLTNNSGVAIQGSFHPNGKIYFSYFDFVNDKIEIRSMDTDGLNQKTIISAPEGYYMTSVFKMSTVSNKIIYTISQDNLQIPYVADLDGSNKLELIIIMI